MGSAREARAPDRALAVRTTRANARGNSARRRASPRLTRASTPHARRVRSPIWSANFWLLTNYFAGAAFVPLAAFVTSATLFVFDAAISVSIV